MAFTGENKISGTDGCSTFSGSWKARFGKLAFRNLTSSMSVCADQNLLHQEMEYLQALSNTDHYQLHGNQLTIWYGDGGYTLIFTRSRPPGLVGARLGKG
jgi:heat shock protein HslJ